MMTRFAFQSNHAQLSTYFLVTGMQADDEDLTILEATLLRSATQTASQQDSVFKALKIPFCRASETSKEFLLLYSVEYS